MFVIVAGGGKVGSYLVRDLSQRKHSVVLIEKRPERCRKIAEENPEVLVIKGDACDIRYLEEGGADRADVIAAVTGDDDDNLVICQIAREVFKIPRIIARVNDPRNQKVFNQVGIKHAISGTSIIGRLIEEEASFGDLLRLGFLKEGNLVLVETELPLNSPVAGKKISEIGFPKECVLLAIIRGEEVIIPKGSVVLVSGDRIIAITSIEKESDFRDILTGKLKPQACPL
jgi:trk system potassium uptake protein TrkA